MPPAHERTDHFVTVLICAYTDLRWTQLTAGVRSSLRQTRTPDEILLVIDYNGDLEKRAAAEFSSEPRVRVVANSATKGLSGARNTGIAASRGDVIAFLDDDALPEPDWLGRLVDAMSDDQVEVVGGRAVAAWAARRPAWFPPEFDWVVGCSHRGLPTTRSDVRNVIGCSMLFRRSAFDRAGPFSTSLGRVGIVPEGCEETELCIRIRATRPEARIVYEPDSVVQHTVSPDRERPAYFVSRCLAEGKSKAAVSRLSSLEQSTSAELDYTLRVLPRALLTNLRAMLSGDFAGAARALFLMLGLALTTTSFVYHNARATLRTRVRRPPRGIRG